MSKQRKTYEIGKKIGMGIALITLIAMFAFCISAPFMFPDTKKNTASAAEVTPRAITFQTVTLTTDQTINYETEINGDYNIDMGYGGRFYGHFANIIIAPYNGQSAVTTVFTAYISNTDVQKYKIGTYRSDIYGTINLGKSNTLFSYCTMNDYAHNGTNTFTFGLDNYNYPTGTKEINCKIAVYSGTMEETLDKWIAFSGIGYGSYEEGYTDGKTDGYNEGFTAGKNEGKTEGYNDGYAAGIEAGKTQGYESGYQQGYEDSTKDQMVLVADLTQETVRPTSEFNIESYEAKGSTITWQAKSGGGGLNGITCRLLSPMLPNVTYLIRYTSTQEFNIGFWDSAYNSLSIYPTPSSFEAGQNKEVYFVMPVSIRDNSSYATNGVNTLYLYPESNETEISISNVSVYQVTNASAVYEEGYKAGETEGKRVGEQQGYDKGYAEGLKTANSGDFFNLISAVIDAPVNAMMSVFDFEILGYNMKSVIISIITICMVMAIIRLFIGARG